MSRERSFALEAAKEITIAHVGNSNVVPCQVSGEQVAEYYEEVFKKILELAKQDD